MLGASFGTCSLVTLVAIGYDRYNVIVRGIAGGKITHFKVTLVETNDVFFPLKWCLLSAETSLFIS